ncbi:histidinol-phosphate transaminase [Silvibacterium acidisoli]|uniref:histidinol-phosphate transaminase n=1 Tax=Acidobacteriaceae bacterium ZG23-2 TaxID=2883246 RepID=UPI00406C46D1
MSAFAETISYGKSYIQSLPLYVPGKSASSVAREYGFAEDSILKLASNENPLGVPESARLAMMAIAANPSACYPDPEATVLKARLQQRFGVPASWITIGSGSSELIDLAAKAFAGRGDSVVVSEYAFALYELAATSVGATAVVTPSRNLGHDLDAMLDAIDAKTTLLYIANPNNPTGTFIEETEIRAFLDHVPEEVVVVLDEAYSEYLPDVQQTSPAKLVEQYPNLVVMRTFSKAHGLAALRIGYCIAQPHLSEMLNRVRPSFNTTSFAQAAAAAALMDNEFLSRTRKVNDAGREQLCDGFDRAGLRYIPSAGNFVLVNVGNGEQVTQALLQQAIVVRPMNGYRLHEWVRISVGLAEHNDRLLRALL